MHEVDLIVTLTGGLTAALFLGYLTHRLGLSPIVGYLLGGTLLGPHTPGLVADVGLAEQMAEIGVILLMFGVGLPFHVEEVLADHRDLDTQLLRDFLGAATTSVGVAHRA